jgi:hypothetical protein
MLSKLEKYSLELIGGNSRVQLRRVKRFELVDLRNSFVISNIDI